MARARWRDTIADFALWIELLGFEPEYPFTGLTGKRRWRFDWGHDIRMVACEYNGMGPGHQGIRGTWRDDEKTTEAQLCGWIVVRCNAKTVESGECHKWVELALAGDRRED